MSSKSVLWVGLLALLVALGFAAGMNFSSKPQPPEPVAVASPSREEKAPAQPAALVERVARPQAELRQDAQPVAVRPPAPLAPPPQRDRADEPLPFPAQALEVELPRGFERVAERVTRECGMPLELVQVDCAEYPCIAWTRATGPAPESGIGVGACAPWKEAFPKATMLVESVRHEEDGGVGERFYALMPIPSESGDAAIAVKRASRRLARIQGELGLRGELP